MVPVVVHKAAWVVPVDRPPIQDGAVAVASGRILAVGRAVELRHEFSGLLIDHGQGAILPALVNTHCHLEFSALHGKIPPQPDLGAWLEAAMAGFASLSPAELLQGVRSGLVELRRSGTALVGEVSNTGQSLPLLEESGLEHHCFYECLGFDLLETGPLETAFPVFASSQARTGPNFSAAAHAPYSVSGPLFGRVREWNHRYQRPSAVHLAESQAEVQFLRHGNGFFKELLQRRGRWRPDFQSPGCSPAVYLDGLGFWGPTTLAVHGLWLDAEDLEILKRRRTWVILCPRSNRHTGAGFPDLPALRRAGLRIALGTDSLASNDDLNLFNEMLCLHEHFPEVPPSELLALGTLHGAEALGRERDFGSLTPGKKAALLLVSCERDPDFWESLLHAGAAGRLTWIAALGKEA